MEANVCMFFYSVFPLEIQLSTEGRVGTALPGKSPPYHCACHRFVDFCDIASHHCLNVLTVNIIFNWQTTAFQQPYIRPFDCKIKNDSLFQQKEQTIYLPTAKVKYSRRLHCIFSVLFMRTCVLILEHSDKCLYKSSFIGCGKRVKRFVLCLIVQRVRTSVKGPYPTKLDW